MSKILRTFSDLHEPFDLASQSYAPGAGLANQRESLHPPAGLLPENPAFAPDELEIGSIVYGRLGQVLPDYGKLRDDARPMLVTGLWRQGESIVKIEAMCFTGVVPKRSYPCDFALDTTALGRPDRRRDSRLVTHGLYILDNSADIFPQKSNSELIKLANDLWPEILVRRASAILFNPALYLWGRQDNSLVREGFQFPSVPFHAVRGDHLPPEVQAPGFQSKAPDFLAQDMVDTIVAFSAAYITHMRTQGRYFFSFPHLDDWPLDLPEVALPDWRKEKLIKRQAAAPVL